MTKPHAARIFHPNISIHSQLVPCWPPLPLLLLPIHHRHVSHNIGEYMDRDSDSDRYSDSDNDIDDESGNDE